MRKLGLQGWTAAAVALISCAAFVAGAEEPAKKPEAATTTAATKPDAEKTAEFKPPPGFRARKRGDVTLYCR